MGDSLRVRLVRYVMLIFSLATSSDTSTHHSTMVSELLKDYNNPANRSQARVALEEMPDDATEQAGSNRVPNEGLETEILVKWQIPGTNDAAAAKRKLIQVIVTLLVAFPEKITIIDRKKQEWVYQETTNEEHFRNQASTMVIQLHPIKNKEQKVIRWVAIIKMKTKTGIQEWKNDDEFYAQASESKVYVFPHPFGHDEWEIASIGFIKDHHAVHYPREFLQDKIHKLLHDQTSHPPLFQLIPQRVTTKDTKATTKAYTIQCLKKHSDHLIHLLTHGNFRQSPNQIFVPFKYKTTQPELFLQCIRQQNDIYHKTWIIKVEGITSAAMSILEKELKQVNGVFHIVPSKRNIMIGEWKILVEQTKCSYIHRMLVKIWPDLMSIVPSNIWEQAPKGFPTPSVSSRKLREYQDNTSDIDSYGSLLTVGTAETTNSLEETTVLDELPVTYQYPTYATVVGGEVDVNSSTVSTQISSPNTSEYLDWQKEKQELESKLQQQAALFEQELDKRFQKYTTLIDQLQSEIQDKISRSQDLEEKLAQAIDLAHDRDSRHEEMMQKFDMLLRMQQGEQNVTSMIATLPSTPVRTNLAPSSPPSKRKNTNATPHRNTYSIFRQNTVSKAAGETRPSHLSNTKDPPQSAPTATMDIDEEDQPPMPQHEAQAGNSEK